MSSDRELLELACKAGGYTRLDQERGTIIIQDDEGHSTLWNPLTDDGDALRLAVKLRMHVVIDEENDHAVAVVHGGALAEEAEVSKCHRGDPYAATRRAIVRAAAAIGASTLAERER